MPPAPALSTRLPRRDRRAGPALGVVLAVLLLHAVLLGWLPQAVGGLAPGAADPALRPMQVRQWVLPAAPAVTGSDAAPVAVAAVVPSVPLSPARPAARSRRAAQPTSGEPAPPVVAAAAGAAPVPVPVPAADASLPIETAAAQATDHDGLAGAAPVADERGPGEQAPIALPAGTPLPTYATRLPPPATLQYAVQRGGPGRAGLQAQLIWRPDLAAASYTLSLGVGAVGSASVGALDVHGIAPERHVETRRGREVRAANFQRQASGGGRITFSGPRLEHPLLPGVQDRLSWMLQLPAVLSAAPALAQPGRELSLQVVGVRGDAALWVFRVVAVQNLPTSAGEVVNAVHLRRDAQHPYDTRVDVWLDPARHHLPVRLRLQNRDDGPGTDFELLRLNF